MRVNFFQELLRHFSFSGGRKRDGGYFINGLVHFFYYCLGVSRGMIERREAHVGLEEYMLKFTQDSNFKNLNFLFNIFYGKYGVGFKLMCTEVDKKYRKKLQTRYLMKLVYLSNKSRRNHLFKLFASFVLNVRMVGLSSRIFHVFSDALVGGVRSEFSAHKKKIFEYLIRKN